MADDNGQKRGRRTREQIEADWYDTFERWDEADRVAALKVLSVVHRSLVRRGTQAQDESRGLFPPEESV
jgi:hypothetical protein